MFLFFVKIAISVRAFSECCRFGSVRFAVLSCQGSVRFLEAVRVHDSAMMCRQAGRQAGKHASKQVRIQNYEI